MRRNGYEWISTFEKALQVEEERFNSPQFRANCPQYLYNFFYFRSGLYGEQLQRYFSLFKREQFHVLTFEEMIADPANSLKAIFQFLGVSSDFMPELGIYNEGKVTARVAQLQYLWHMKVTGPQRIRSLGLEVLQKINMSNIPPIDAATKRHLLSRYSADLQVLYDLTGIRFVPSQ